MICANQAFNLNLGMSTTPTAHQFAVPLTSKEVWRCAWRQSSEGEKWRSQQPQHLCREGQIHARVSAQAQARAL